MLRLALQRLRDVGHRAVVVVVEIAGGRAGVPAFRPVGMKRDRRIEDLERVGIFLRADRLSGPLQQEIAGVRAGLCIGLQQQGDDPGRLVRVLGDGEPGVEVGPRLLSGVFSGACLFCRLSFGAGSEPPAAPRLGLAPEARRIAGKRRRPGQEGRDCQADV